MALNEFEESRLRRLYELDNSHTNPEEALELAKIWLRENETTGNVIIIIEKAEGGVTYLSSKVTLAAAVYILEATKLTLMQSND